jgi:hypothetical protein
VCTKALGELLKIGWLSVCYVCISELLWMWFVWLAGVVTVVLELLLRVQTFDVEQIDIP